MPASNSDENKEDEQCMFILRKDRLVELYKYSSQRSAFEKVMNSALNFGKPISIVNNKLIYAASFEKSGVLNRVTLNGERTEIKPLNLGIAQPIAVFRIPIQPNHVNKPPGSTFDLILGSNCRQDAIVLCTTPGPES